MDIAVIVGSLREGSLNRKVARALALMAPEPLKLREVELAGCSLYNQDRDNDPPADWVALRDSIRPADGLLFVTPEYNRSIPGILKNAIDIGSRPYGQSVWEGKPGAIVSASPGAYGGFGANHHLRQCCVFLDIPLLQQPETYLSRVKDDMFDADGAAVEPQLGKSLGRFMTAYAAWVQRLAA